MKKKPNNIRFHDEGIILMKGPSKEALEKVKKIKEENKKLLERFK